MNNIQSVTSDQKNSEIPESVPAPAQGGEGVRQDVRRRPGALIGSVARGPVICFLLVVLIILLIIMPLIFPVYSSINSEADIHNENGIEAYDRGEYREALNHFQEGLAIIREVGDRAAEGATLNNIGVVYERQGLYEQAWENYCMALVIARDMRNRPLEERILNNMEDILNRMPTKEARIRLWRHWLV